MSVLSSVRTLVEKLVLVHTAHPDRDLNRIERTARHYYDLHELLGRQDVLDEIEPHGIDALARDILTYSIAAALPAAPRPPGGFANSPAFTTGSDTLDRARNAYNQIIDQFLWPGTPRPTFNACLERVHATAHTL